MRLNTTFFRSLIFFLYELTKLKSNPSSFDVKSSSSCISVPPQQETIDNLLKLREDVNML
jgi:hypothetical protein